MGARSESGGFSAGRRPKGWGSAVKDERGQGTWVQECSSRWPRCPRASPCTPRQSGRRGDRGLGSGHLVPETVPVSLQGRLGMGAPAWVAMDRRRREGWVGPTQAGGQALSRTCACSLASSRKDASSRGKPSVKAGPKAWGPKGDCSPGPGPRRRGRPGTAGGPGPSQGSRGSGMAGGRANGSPGASGSLGAATAPDPDSRRSWRRHLARRFWNHTWR